MNWDFKAWWEREPHHWKYTDDHPAYLAAQEAWSARDAELAALRAENTTLRTENECLSASCKAALANNDATLAECERLKASERSAWNAAVARDEECERLRETKDGAYLERNRCVALIARMALAMGLRAGLARTAIEGWSEDWHGCVYIDLPTGQCSWHFHDSQAHLFDGLPTYAGKWDGHTTPEKYGRVDAAMR